MPLRITFLTHYYPPEVGAPQRRLGALARALSERGAQVTVHTGFPHYPVGIVQSPYRNRPLHREDQEAVRVVRSLVYPAANRGMGGRLTDHAVFAASALAAGPAAGRADVVVVESPPLFLGAAAPIYAKMRGASLILHVSDLWPDSAIELGAVTSTSAIRAARMLERHAYSGAAEIVVPTKGILRVLEGHPKASGKLHRIPPAVDLHRFAAPPLQRKGPLRVLYAGTVGLAQGVQTLVQAARIVGPERVRVVIAGDGAELDDVRAAAADLDHVSVLGSIAAEEVPRLYAEADVGVVLLRDRPVFRGALPTKTLEVMAAGRPLVLSADGESAEFVREAAAGLTVPPEDPNVLADALLRLASASEPTLRALGSRGLRCAQGFDRSVMADRWWHLLAEASAAPRRRRAA